MQFDIAHLVVVVALLPLHELDYKPLADRIYDPGEVMLEKEDALFQAGLQGSAVSVARVK